MFNVNVGSFFIYLETIVIADICCVNAVTDYSYYSYICSYICIQHLKMYRYHFLV